VAVEDLAAAASFHSECALVQRGVQLALERLGAAWGMSAAVVVAAAAAEEVELLGRLPFAAGAADADKSPAVMGNSATQLVVQEGVLTPERR